MENQTEITKVTEEAIETQGKAALTADTGNNKLKLFGVAWGTMAAVTAVGVLTAEFCLEGIPWAAKKISNAFTKMRAKHELKKLQKNIESLTDEMENDLK